MMNEEKEQLKEVLNDILDLGIEDIRYDSELELGNTSAGYEFNLLKIKALLNTKDIIEIYLKTVKNNKIKESIFCYWCALYEEEILDSRGNKGQKPYISKVLITELLKQKYQQSIFLEIENNQTQILEEGTEVNFVEITNYINEYKDEKNKLEKLLKYFDEDSDDLLMVGIKIKRENIEKNKY